MTETDKPVTRRSQRMVYGNKQCVVTIGPGDVIQLRLAGEKASETVAIADIYSLAVKQRVAFEQKLKGK